MLLLGSSDCSGPVTPSCTVLEGGFIVEIDGDRLTVTSSGGEGLSYTAES